MRYFEVSIFSLSQQIYPSVIWRAVCGGDAIGRASICYRTKQEIVVRNWNRQRAACF